jgi:hypothetical protein
VRERQMRTPIRWRDLDGVQVEASPERLRQLIAERSHESCDHAMTDSLHAVASSPGGGGGVKVTTPALILEEAVS